MPNEDNKQTDKNSEAAAAPTATASEAKNPVDQNKSADSAASVADRVEVGKLDPMPEPSSDEAIESEPGDAVALVGANPIPVANGGVLLRPENTDSPSLTAKRGRGRPPKAKPGSKNEEVKSPTSSSVEAASDGVQNSGSVTAELGVVARTVLIADLILRAPFSTLLPIDDETFASIKGDMQASGFDKSQPIHVWQRGGELVVDDGCTRVKAAQELGITEAPAFVHSFEDEAEALAFAIKCQVNRRNIKDGELIGLVSVFDATIKQGSNQQRQANGAFARTASGDALGKSAGRTAKKLGVSTTKIERARQVMKKADAATKKDLADNKITINAALKRIDKAGASNRTRTINHRPMEVEALPRALRGQNGSHSR